MVLILKISLLPIKLDLIIVKFLTTPFWSMSKIPFGCHKVNILSFLIDINFSGPLSTFSNNSVISHNFMPPLSRYFPVIYNKNSQHLTVIIPYKREMLLIVTKENIF